MKAFLFIMPAIVLAAVSCGTAKYQAPEAEDEVVGTGYQKALQKDVTGSAKRIKIKDTQFTNIYEYLRGCIAGLDVEGDTSSGSVPTIRIRGVNTINGSNDPLVIVDGMYDSVSGIANINPQDVDSVDVLKDASMTAAYGVRGAGGVIIINLKRGGE